MRYGIVITAAKEESKGSEEFGFLDAVRIVEGVLQFPPHRGEVFLISNFCRVLNVVCFLLGNSPVSEFYMPTFWNTLSVPSSWAGRYEEWLGLRNVGYLYGKRFTMEKEEKDHLPFLDIDIYRKTVGSLGHKVYCKPTHTNLYLHKNLHHHPANKQSVLASLIHRAEALGDQDSLTQVLEFLTTVFKDNEHSPQQIQRAMEPTTRTAKTNDKPTSTAYIPYTQTTYG